MGSIDNSVDAVISSEIGSTAVPNGHDTNGVSTDLAQHLTRFSLDEPTIDDPRPLKVAVLGAGLSGVLAGILLPAKVPKIQLTIFEKNHEVVSVETNHWSSLHSTLTISSTGRNMAGEYLPWSPV